MAATTMMIVVMVMVIVMVMPNPIKIVMLMTMQTMTVMIAMTAADAGNDDDDDHGEQRSYADAGCDSIYTDVSRKSANVASNGRGCGFYRQQTLFLL